MSDLYQEVTDRIVTAIEAGTPPWVKPWSVSDFRPRNATTQRPYRGVNSVLLNLEADLRGFADPRWCTFRRVLVYRFPPLDACRSHFAGICGLVGFDWEGEKNT